LPGLEVRDRGLALDGRAVCDLVARERGGRLVLVRLAPEDDDATALAALDLVAAARGARESILVHLGSLGGAGDSLGAPEAPRAILVLRRGAGAGLVRRLEPLLAAGLELAAPLAASSALGETFALAFERAEPGGAGGGSRPGVDGFLAALAPGRRELALLALRRLERVDEDLDRRASVEALAFRHEGRPLCELLAERGELVGRLADGARVELRAGADLDRFLEGVLGALVGGEPPEDAPPDRARSAAERLREHDLVPRSTAALLSPEELEAFRV
jgi:hypothetical protein